MGRKWIEPARDARFLCDDGIVRTWGELAECIAGDACPCCMYDYEILIWCYGAKPLA